MTRNTGTRRTWTRKTWMVLAVLVVTVAGLVGWLVQGLDTSAPLGDMSEASAKESAGASASTATAALEDAAADPGQRDVVRANPASAEEAVVDDSELADAWWVEGRVVLPNEVPLDEEIWVVAQGRKFEKRPLHKVKLGNDGRFRVAFAKKTKKGTLDVSAHYVYLQETPSMNPAEPPADIVLAPLVGGRIRGRATVPIGRDDLKKRAEGAAVSLNGWDRVGRAPPRAANRGAKLDAELEFDLGGLPTAAEYHLSIQPKDMASAQKQQFRVQAGKALDVELELVEGARVSGKVVDAAGEPVAGATIGIEHGGDMHLGMPLQSGKDGTIQLNGLRAGKATIKASKKGFTEAVHTLDGLRDGDVIADVVLRLARGMAISGRVQWPDGSPAAGAHVGAEREGEHGFSFMGQSPGIKCAADGSFELTGLEEGAYVVRANAKRAGEEPPPERLELPEAAAAPSSGEASGPAGSAASAVEGASKPVIAKKRPRGPSWNAEREDVAAGTNGLVLTLDAGLAIAGRVVDDAGEPLTKFKINAIPIGEREWDRDWQRQQNRAFDAPDGRYKLEGLTEGRWELTADLKGVLSGKIVVEVPGSAAVADLVVPRAGTVTGRVLDAAGKPLAGASVKRAEQDRHWSFGGGRAGTDHATTDATGRFEFDRVPVGLQKFSAGAEGHAGSGPVEVTVLFGTPAEIELRLRAGGTIRGLVYDVHGRPDAGRKITGWGQEQQGHVEAECDALGRFVLEHVDPGSWHLNTQANDAEREAARDGKGEVQWERSRHVSVSKTVKVEDGRTVEVQLGGAAKDAVTVRGTVTRAGKPVGGLRLHVSKHAEGENQSTQGFTEDDGRYELLVPGPGKYSLSLQGEGTASYSRQLEVPAGGAFTFDVVLPSGSLRGRVRDRAGNPLEGVQVSVMPERGVARGEGATSDNEDSGADGTFAFAGLAPGTYRVQAGGARWGNEGRWGGVTQSGVVVPEDGTATEVVLVLDRAGTVTGLVVGADGRPAANAGVHVIGSDGDLHRGWNRTDEHGRFTIAGLAPGRVMIGAADEDDVCARPATADVISGERSEVQITLVRGGSILVGAEEADGRKVGAGVRIVDEHGLDRTALCRGTPVPGAEGEPPRWKYAPLPPGRYRLTSKNKDGVEAVTEVSVTSGNQSEALLRFGG